MSAYAIRMGMPEMDQYWTDLSTRADNGQLDREEQRQFKQLVKALRFLSANPRHPGLQSHEIDDLSRRYGIKVWQSYLENRTPAAGRLFWPTDRTGARSRSSASSRIRKTRSMGHTIVLPCPACLRADPATELENECERTNA